MSDVRVPLYDRLPEAYRTRDAEQSPPDLLRAYLGLVENAFSAVHENVESLYHDLFIDTCDDWVVPYLADLLGTSHLAGDPWTVRADVADTIALRRRKGTRTAVERAAFDLTSWGTYAVELRKNLVWAQHLNHQRPDSRTPGDLAWGGTIEVRRPATLSLVDSPFDPFAHFPDVSAADFGNIRYNLPNLAIFLWRLTAYRVDVSRPVARDPWVRTSLVAPSAAFVARFDIHPLQRPVRLFGRLRFDPSAEPPVLATPDGVPGPIAPARLTSNDPAGNPGAYVRIDDYDPADLATVDVTGEPLQLHMPQSVSRAVDPTGWRFRGANLCAWEIPLRPPLRDHEVAIDPVIGRLAIGVPSDTDAQALLDQLLVTYTYGAVGPVGAHPIPRSAAPDSWEGEAVPPPVVVDQSAGSPTLADSLSSIANAGPPLVVEIRDSAVHDLDLALVANSVVEDGGPNLVIARPLILRAGDGKRPIVRLRQPLRLRPATVGPANPRLVVRLEGLHLVAGSDFAADDPLVARVALHALELQDTTLDPGSHLLLDRTRGPARLAFRLAAGYGFSGADVDSFGELPSVRVRRSQLGPIHIDSGYRLSLGDTLVDAGAPDGYAISGTALPLSDAWGPPLAIDGITVFGRTRVEQASGRGGIFVGRLEVLDNQTGCLKLCCFSGDGDRLPQNADCVFATDVRLVFTGETPGQPSYGQLAYATDAAVRERGPRDDAMGAFGFLVEAHRWRNLQIRLRELMPVGVRPLLVPVT